MTIRANAAVRRGVHLCHAEGCGSRVPPAMFMCRRHWYMLPKTLRDAVWAAYVPGQEQRMDPTEHYLDVTRRAIDYTASAEARGSR